MFRKILLIDMQIFQIPIKQQCHLILILSVFWTFICLKNKPFDDSNLNIIDYYCNSVACIILFSGCLYLFGVNNFVKPAIFIFIILINVILLLKVIKSSLDVFLEIQIESLLIGRFKILKILYFSLMSGFNLTKFQINICQYICDVFKRIKMTYLELKHHNKIKQIYNIRKNKMIINL